MLNHSRWTTAIIAVVILALPVAARGQTGILHKRGPAGMQTLPAGVLPATTPPGVAAGVPVIPGAGDQGGMSRAAGAAAKALPLPVSDGAALPGPIHGDALVHALPVAGGPVSAMGSAAGYDGRSVGSSSIGLSGPRPPGLERAAAVASNYAVGLEQASMATGMAAGRGMPPPRQLSADQSGILPRSGPAAGGRSDAAAIPSRGEPTVPSRAAQAVPLQPVGQLPTTPEPRWRDRLRFSWPGGH